MAQKQIRVDVEDDSELHSIWETFKGVSDADTNNEALRRLFEMAGITGKEELGEFVEKVESQEWSEP